MREVFHSQLNLTILVGHRCELCAHNLQEFFSRTAEPLADTLTKGAFTDIQWKSLMRVFDIHPPSDLNVDRSFSESDSSVVFCDL